MTALNRNDILAIINDAIDGNKPLQSWEYLVSINHKDLFTREWVIKLKELENQFHIEGSGILISDEGIARLIQLRDELEREG